MIASSIFTPMRTRCRKVIAGAALLFIGSVSAAFAQEGASLNEILFSKLPGDDVQINIITDQQLDEPGSFSTDTPARIALDFFGVKNKLANSRRAVEAGKVESILAVETADRTRLVINLYDSARYKLTPTDDGYSITVFNTQFDNSIATAPKPFATRPVLLPDTMVDNVDFRRSEAGGGKLVVDFNDDGVTVDTRERDGEIVVDLLGATLPANLERRLDVTDFATPVQTIDAFQNGDNVRLVVVPQGKSQHISFQAGKRFTLVVDPIIETEEDLRNADDAALGFEGERLSINFQKIDVRSALAVIADFTGINFVTSDSVQGEVTLNLKDVPWDQALSVILRSKGLSQRRNGDIIWVAPSEEIQEFEEKELRAKAVVNEFAPLVTEVIQINYARAEDIADVIESIEVVSQGVATGGANANNNGVLAGLPQTETSTNSILSARGSVTVDERTNSILVQDVADNIKALREVVSKLDKPVRQVLIETRIVEANDSFSRELGARLGFQRITENARFPGVNDSNIGDIVSSGTTEGLTVIQDSRVDDEPGLIFDTSRGTPGGLAVDLGANTINGTNPSSFAFDIFRSGTGFAHLITLELSALEAEGKGRVVASPRLVTANQREAMISQGQEIVESVDVLATGAGGGGGGITETIEAELTLRVTPQITPDDRVIMDVSIEQDTIISLAPIVLGTQEIDTQVLADNGETVVIGGIYQEDTNVDIVKVPLLGDIPIIGRLFRQRSSRNDRTELLIFLTPKIISPKLNLG